MWTMYAAFRFGDYETGGMPQNNAGKACRVSAAGRPLAGSRQRLEVAWLRRLA